MLTSIHLHMTGIRRGSCRSRGSCLDAIGCWYSLNAHVETARQQRCIKTRAGAADYAYLPIIISYSQFLLTCVLGWGHV